MFVSRKAAKAAGDTLYYTGKPCVHGHLVQRYVSSNICIECNRLNTARWRSRNLEDRKAKQRVYKARWRSENPELAKESRNKSVQLWAARYPEKVRAKRAKRRSTKLSATPSWLSPVDFAEIEGIYQHAQVLEMITGSPHDVDHIVPLQGKNVCGLHVPWNLQAIPASTNRSKSNSTDQADCASVYDEEFDVWHLSQPHTSQI